MQQLEILVGVLACEKEQVGAAAHQAKPAGQRRRGGSLVGGLLDLGEILVAPFVFGNIGIPFGRIGEELAGTLVSDFWDEKNGGFFSTVTQGDLMARRKEADDNALPSANSMAALLFAGLARETGKPLYAFQARRTAEAFGTSIARAPVAYPILIAAYSSLAAEPTGKVPLVTLAGPTSVAASSVGSRVTVDLKVVVQPGWHINATKVTEKYLVPTALKVVGPAGTKLLSATFPKAKMATFGFSTAPIAVLDGTFIVKVTVAPIKVVGSAKLEFFLSYQPCNDRSCELPTEARVEVLLRRGSK